MKHESNAHPREILACGPICKVERCACGCVHLTLGAVTLRLDPAACASLWATLGEALSALEERREPEAEVGLTVWPSAHGRPGGVA